MSDTTNATVLDTVLCLREGDGLSEADRDTIRHYAGGAIRHLTAGTAIRDYFGLCPYDIRRETALRLADAAFSDIARGAGEGQRLMRLAAAIEV